jgi:hypothetical protein
MEKTERANMKPYAWIVSGCSKLWFDLDDAKREAKHCGGTATVVALYEQSEMDQAIDRCEQAVDEASYFRREHNSVVAERDRLRELIPQAWRAGMECVADSGPCLDQWMKQKGLA